MLYKVLIKRIIDLMVSTLALLLLSPIFLIIAIALSITYRGNPFFIQPRPGRNTKIFKIIKFRTMNMKCNDEGILLPDSERITAIGRFIRRTSLDELPQLINVLKGDMSLIGPRPLVVQYIPFYTDQENRRHSIRPGLTGLAQINGRNALTWESKFHFDNEYVDKMNFIMDATIFFKTIKKVFKRENIGIRGIDAPEDFNKYRSKQNEFSKKEYNI